ncbi:MAG TPA: SMI1/KNR4 family protein [Ohtaekwangia sp.]|uniref:SMI1/KNR4 family protein n=1 Tax=Ohtaekwangia sp. TaxID=2066019 RepID=UPI002F950034
MEMRHKLRDITQNDLKVLNEKLGFEVSPSYSNFLLTNNNGGQPIENTFRKFDENNKLLNEVGVNVFLGIDENLTCDLYHNSIILSDRIPSDLLPIAHDGIGNVICIGTGKDNFEKIFIWYDNERDLDESPSYRDVEFLSDSFNEFINGLGQEDI